MPIGHGIVLVHMFAGHAMPSHLSIEYYCQWGMVASHFYSATGVNFMQLEYGILLPIDHGIVLVHVFGGHATPCHLCVDYYCQ